MEEKTAILVMMVPETSVALSRLLESLDKFRGGARVFASLDQGYCPALPDWITPIVQPVLEPRGIVRPTKYALGQLNQFDWILRLAWDAEMVSGLDFPKDKWVVYGTPFPYPAAPPDIAVARAMGGSFPSDGKTSFPVGYAVLAHRLWWEKTYLKLPLHLEHYGDEVVSFVYSLGLGYSMENRELAKHRHKEWRKFDGVVYDCFTFFDECDLLELRLHEMGDLVAKFILVEGETTHSGLPKPSYFNQNKARFAKFLPQIEHRIVKFPETKDPWVREQYQRDSIMSVLGEIGAQDSDLVIVSDLDEIPSRLAIEDSGAAFLKDQVVGLRQNKYNFKFNLLGETDWCYAFASRLGVLKQRGLTLSQIRRAKRFDHVIDCGWHFSWCGRKVVEEVDKKLQSYAHQELNNPKSREKILTNLGVGSYFRDGVMLAPVLPDATYPRYVLDNIYQFRDYFYYPGCASDRIVRQPKTLLVGFWHVYQVNNWKEIVKEQFDLLVSSGLLDQFQFLHVNVVGSKEEFSSLVSHPKLKVTSSENQWEIPTIKHIYEYSKVSSAYVLYIHTKGVTNGRHAWRRYIQSMVIGQWQDCVKKLGEWDAVGLEFKERPYWHFCGNFWWADTDYLRTLGDPTKLSHLGRGAAEIWIGHTRRLRAFSFRNIGINLYLKNPVAPTTGFDDKSLFSEYLYYLLVMGSNHLGVFGGCYQGGIQLQYNPEELAVALDWLRNRGPFKSMLEVGAARGGFTRVVKDLLALDRVYVIDDGRYDTAPVRRALVPEAQEWVGNSHSEACAKQLVQWGEQFDLVVLDGDRSYKGVVEDINLVVPHMHSGSFCLLHDIRAVGEVKQVLEDVRKEKLPLVEEVTFGEGCPELCGLTITRKRS